MGLSDSGIPGGRHFPETPWSALVRLRAADSATHDEDLARLVNAYWKPVYCVIRQFWVKSDQDAKDLTQEFFADHVLAGDLLSISDARRGSFRALLKTAVTNFMRNHVRDAGRLKRGAGQRTLAIDDGAVDLTELLPTNVAGPDEAFDHAWNQVVLGRAVELLEARLHAEGRAHHFEIFRRYDLEMARAEVSYAEVGAPLGLTAGQVKRALTQSRALLRDLLVEIVRGYVDGPEALAEELEALLGGS